MLGGELRISNSIKFILSLGIRFFSENLAADLGFVLPAGSRIKGFPFIPWVGFTYNFGV